jgi:hypothetical protein
MSDNMKKRFLLLFAVLLTLSSFSAKAQNYNLPFVSHTPVFDVTQRNLSEVLLEDGVYELEVDYSSNTGHDASYVLDVRIQDDKVTYIYFPNGGSVHSGRNSSGYTWRGGGIRWNLDYYGNIKSGRAVIQVNYRDGSWQLFTIYL